MIESFEKEKNYSEKKAMPRTITTNCNDYQPCIRQIVRIEAKDDRGNVIFSIDGGDITISVENNNNMGYHF